jgi:hypothetical protein
MNTNSTKTIIITASAAAICVGGSWLATPAQAKTDVSGGGKDPSSVIEIDEVVAMRKAQMANDYVANVAARAEYAARAR